MLNSYYKDIYNLLCKKYPNRGIYVISDHHFYHYNIIKYNRPEFKNVDDMNDYIINSHNNVVGEDDIVIFLGDFSFKKSPIKDLLNRMNGHKYLLFGNHDGENLVNCYGKLGFEEIFVNPVKINDSYLSHYPLCDGECDNFNFELLVKEFNKCSGVNYHGHIHTTDFGEKPFVNVCCEAQKYKPLLIGYTKEKSEESNLDLIINSKYFEDILNYLKENKNMNPNLLISDYIYSMLLESITSYVDSSFVYGSFPFYKKYGFVSNFSDLDVGFIYKENLSKNKNIYLLKESFERVFEDSKNIDNLNISIDKMFSNMRIFKLLYTNKNGNTYRGYYDSNLVPIDIYRDTDFITVSGNSTLENALIKDGNLISGFKYPKFKSKFLTLSGDISNLVLQLLFQQGFDKKRDLTLRKLKYLYRAHNTNDVVSYNNLEDTMTRFFIRNMMFFYTTNRNSEIEYVKKSYNNFDNIINSMPINIKLQMEKIIKNNDSLFNNVYQELINTNFTEIPEKSKKLAKIIK